jgi:hypothetical protein
VFFPISSLTLCAAVRPVDAVNAATGEVMAKFVSLNSDIAAQNAKNPARAPYVQHPALRQHMGWLFSLNYHFDFLQNKQKYYFNTTVWNNC